MKRIIGFLITVFVILSIIPFSAFAADAKMIYGDSMIIDNPVGADSLVIDGVTFNAGADIKFNASIVVSDCSNEKSAIYLNGKSYQKLVDGENIVSLSTDKLIEGENELRLMLGAGSAVYGEDTVYGSVNIDDICVESVSFSGITFDKPASMNCYMPISGEAGMIVKNVPYKDKQSVGDGWVQSTGLGGNTPDVPVSVGFTFNKPSSDGIFVIDTTKLSDGKHTAEYVKDGKTVSTQEFIVDNSAPVIEFSIKNGASVSRLDKININTADISKIKTELYVDGKKSVKIDTKKLSAGSHTAIFSAIDEAGNASSETLVFNIVDRYYTAEFNENSVTMSVLGEGTVYNASLVTDLRMFENRLGELNQSYLRSADEVLVSFDNKAELTTSAIGDSVPYQSFVINTDDIDEDFVLVSYSGETGNGSKIALKAWNYTESRWDKLATCISGESVTFEVPLEKYSYKKKMRINAIPDMVYNGSDTIVWNSDTQYYSRFDDLNEFYYAIANYTVEQYNAGNIGYYVHTGDLVDQTNAGSDVAHKEYKVASDAQKILDDAKVPNGVVSGNHDIVHTESNYSYYWKYFGESRYKDFDWYGGSLNNNMHHYDLVSIGVYDFVFMYLGCYNEIQEDTIAWANAVCQAYPNRNVVICTHEYLLPSGQYSSERSQVIWDEIVVPNENVKLILCGHNEGICDQVRQVGDTDRYVLEILADYQFAELGAGPQHVINNCTCDGEGYVRLMTFSEAGQLISTTYSPMASKFDIDPYNYYPSYSDSFVYDMDLIRADRSIKTTEFNVVSSFEELGKIGEDEISLKGCGAFFAKINYKDQESYSKVYVLNEYEVDYTPDDEPKYETNTPEKIIVTGHANVSENFRMNESNELPDSKLIEMGLNLMPTSVNMLYQTSGSKTFTTKLNDRGGITISHEYGNNANWVTLANNINKRIDVSEYDRIYFGVSTNKNAKWNIYVNFQGKEINFSQNKDVASLFGYVNDAPSDIKGTWNGYIDLKDMVQGEQIVKSIYIVTATPGATVTFDYLFLGKSNGGKVRFVTDDTISVAYEDLIGNDIALPSDAFKQGYVFEGWFNAKEGGEKVISPVKVANETTTLYARFTEKRSVVRDVEVFNTEINLHRPAVGKMIFVIASLLIMVLVVIVLVIKIKTSKRK